MSEFDTLQISPNHHLSNISIGQRPSGLIAPELFSVVSVPTQRGSYTVWGTENFKAPEDIRQKGSISNKITFSVSSADYNIPNRGLRDEIPLEDLANDQIGVEEAKTFALTDNMALAWEVRVANLVTNTSNVGSSVTLTSSGNFNDFANSEPQQAIEDGLDAVRFGAKADANRIIFGVQAWKTFKQHPQIQNLIFPHGGGIPTPAQVAALFFNDNPEGRVLIAKSIYDSAEENQTASFSDVWGDDIFIGYVNPRPSRFMPSFGYSFEWTPANFPAANAVITDDENKAGSKHVRHIEILRYQIEKVTLAGAGYLIKDVNV